MHERVINFAAGPATLPLPVLEQARRDLVSLPGIGISPLEISHRSVWFEGVLHETVANLRGLLGVPDTHEVLFIQGGASQQFSMVPMNLLRGSDRSAEYAVTGSWGEKAVREAEKEGPVRIAWTGAEGGFASVPHAEEWRTSPDAAYLHVTSNETIEGVQWPALPTVPEGVPLVVDASSDFLSAPVDLDAVSLLYAGVQKNAGPAGVTVVIAREDLLGRASPGLPTMLDYRTFADHDSRYNTPPVFAIYIVMLVTRWLLDEGGLEAQARRNQAKAALLYDAIDGSGGFYGGHADTGARSLMNVTFRLPTRDLEARFVVDAASRGLVELAGHRSVGGIRASIYNAMPLAGAEALAAFMTDFADAHRSGASPD